MESVKPQKDEELERAMALMPRNGSKGEVKEVGGEPDDDYDPHLYRKVPHPTSNFESLAHLLKGCLGTGILAMHEAFHNSGWLSGVVNMAIIGFICTYCFHILVRTQYILCKQYRVPLLSYPQSMKLALQQGPRAVKWISPAAVPITDGFLIIYQLGVCICYLVFVAKNVEDILHSYGVEISLTKVMLFMFLPLLGINLLRNLKVLAPLSTLANIVTFIGLGVVLYYVFQDLPPLSERPMFGPIEKFPLYFGTVLFALEAVGVVIALENNMKTPKSFGSRFGVLNVGMTLVTIMYGFVGFFGYLKYGADSKDSISLNIPKGLIPDITRGLFTFAIFISYGLQCYVPISIIWDNYVSEKVKSSRHSTRYQLILRIVITIFTFMVAAAVPELGLFISLFGAFCLSILGLAFPALMELCVLYPDKLGKLNWVMWKDIGLIIFAMIGLVSGTYSSLRNIIATFQ
ncbi:CLUMA_CG009017, isoform A [Clunio marinus]|uniref:CLUMA_CG009017, isoform A n=1 Tax=Clunio marinus TaxID=568069 RepID=A0A1J1I5J3_9DIPT|nr:CLUMA_CG009017, isoform A [Clunio marinus]